MRSEPPSPNPTVSTDYPARPKAPGPTRTPSSGRTFPGLRGDLPGAKGRPLFGQGELFGAQLPGHRGAGSTERFVNRPGHGEHGERRGPAAHACTASDSKLFPPHSHLQTERKGLRLNCEK